VTEKKTENNDEALMRRYQEGDSAAFELLYQRYSAKVYGYLRKKLKTEVEADEVFQNVFLKFHRSRLLYSSEYPVLQWLFVIARTSLLDHLKAQAREQGRRQAFSEEEKINPTLSQNPELVALSKSEPEILAKAGLSDEQRQVLQLKIGDELSYEQIAERLRKSPESIRQIFSRGLKRVRKAWFKKQELK